MLELSCNKCPAKIETQNVAEAVRWDVSHDEVCPALNSELEGSEPTA